MDIKSKTLEIRSVGLPPPRIPVTTRITIYFVWDPYTPSFVTVTWRVDNARYPCEYLSSSFEVITSWYPKQPVFNGWKW